MELKKTINTKGYKQTEVGLIPEDWEVVSLGSIFTFYSTSNFSKAEMFDTGEVGCIHYGLIHAINNSQYNLKNGVKYYVGSDQAKYEFVREGDVIMVDASEDLEGLNKSVEVYELGSRKYISGLHTYLLRDKNSLLANHFRGIVLNSKIVKTQMLQLAVGMKVFGVSKTQLVNIQIPLPPLTEQKAIANALSDLDALISSLEQLITKKKAIKQGAMQELLTPKDGWEVKKLGEIFHFKQGLQCPIEEQFETNNNDRVRFIRIIDLTNNHEPHRFISKPEIGHIINNKDLFMVRYGTPGLIGFGYSGVIANNLFRLIPKYKVEADFFFHLIKNKNQEILNLSSSTTMAALSFGPLSLLKLIIPKDLEEQKAIAQILSDMDLEIASLEAKKEKYQGIKQGMMQELLTGKTRLV